MSNDKQNNPNRDTYGQRNSGAPEPPHHLPVPPPPPPKPDK